MNLLLFKSLSVRWTLASSVPPFLFLRATLILPSTSNQPPPPPHRSPQLTSTTRHSYQHPRSHISFVLLFVKCPAVPLLDILLQTLELCLLPQSLASLLCASLSWCLHCLWPSPSLSYFFSVLLMPPPTTVLGKFNSRNLLTIRPV